MKVLLVEDNPVTLTGTEEYLRHHGHAVQGAGNGHAALTRTAVERYDLVVADYVMPGMDGLEFLEALRRDPVTRDLPVLLWTAVAGEDYAGLSRRVLALGPAILAQKPVELPELLSFINRLPRRTVP